MDKLILLIDGDNITENYTKTIFDTAQTFGEVYEAHCFADFVKRKQSWYTAYTECKTQLHYIPASEKQKGRADPNTSDIALTAFAVERLYELPEIDVCIIAANDKDYIPLAKVIREKFHKKAVMLYTEQKDKAVVAFDQAILLRNDDNGAGDDDNDAGDDDNDEQVKHSDDVVISACIETRMEGKEYVLLSALAKDVKNAGIAYGKSLGKYLEEMFDNFPWLSNHYVLKLGDKKDRVERVVK